MTCVFSVTETTIFLEQALAKEIDPDTASSWRKRAEGRVADLQLATTTSPYSDVIDEKASGKRAEATEELAEWREVLTNREYEILLLLNQRLRDKEIASQLCISIETVKSHTKSIREKLNTKSRRDAVAKAIALKILPPN